MEYSEQVEEKFGKVRRGPVLAQEDPWTPAERALAASVDDLLQDLQHQLLKDVLRLHRKSIADSLSNVVVDYTRPAVERKDKNVVPLDSPRRNKDESPGKYITTPVNDSQVVLDLDRMKIEKKIPPPSTAKPDDDVLRRSREGTENDEHGKFAPKASGGTRISWETSGTQARYDKIGMLAQKLHGRDILTTPLQVFVCSPGYTFALCAAILFQAILMGWEAHAEMAYETNRVSRLPATEPPKFIQTANLVLTATFALDVMFRLAVLREKYIFANDPDNRGWNLFDLTLVIICLPDFFPAYDFVNFSILRTCRLLRVIRILHVARSFKELRKMIFALMHCLSALFWLTLLMFILIYMFALVFMQGASAHLATMEPYDLNSTDVDVRRLKSRGGSSSSSCDNAIHPYASFEGLDMSMRSLFNVVVGNEDWTMVLKAVADSNGIMAAWSFFFSVFFFFGFMNVATGLFVEKAMAATSQDRDMMLNEQVQKEKEEIAAMKELFQGADADGDGNLTKRELKQAILHPDVRSWLASIDLDISADIDNVLAILDPQDQGQIVAEEFYDIIGRFKGKARSVELMLVLMEARKSEAEAQKANVLAEQTLAQIQVEFEEFRNQMQLYMDDVLKSHKKYNV